MLKPGGRLIFIEHVHAHDNPGRARWQKRLEPYLEASCRGCHLTRDTLSYIEDEGFEVKKLTRESLRKAPPFIRPSIRGVAQKGL